MDVEQQRKYLHQQMMDACVPLVRDAAIPLKLDTGDTYVCAILMGLCSGMFDAGVRTGRAQFLAELGEHGVENRDQPGRLSAV